MTPKDKKIQNHNLDDLLKDMELNNEALKEAGKIARGLTAKTILQQKIAPASYDKIIEILNLPKFIVVI